MTTNFVVLLALNMLALCTAFSESPLMQFQAKSFDVVSAMKQAASVLNVPVPGKDIFRHRFHYFSLNN